MRPRLSDQLAGILWMALAMSFIAIVDGIAKYLAGGIHGIQVTWGYFVSMLLHLLVYVAARPGGLRRVVLSRRPGLQVLRGLCLVMSLSCLFVGLAYLPLAEATTISFTAPLFIVALAGPLLAETIGVRRWAAVAVGMLGAVLVVRPGSSVFQWAALLPLVGALFFALFSIVTRRLSAHDPTLTTLFFTFATGAAVTSAAMPVVWVTPDPPGLLLMLFSGTLGVLAHGSMVRGLTVAHASAVAPMNYVRLVWALGIGYAVFGQIPDTLSLAGGAVIVGSGLYVVFRESRSRAPVVPPAPNAG